MSAKHVPTDFLRGKIEGLAASGMTQENVARTVGLSLSTLRKHYLPQLELAQAQRVAAVAQNLFEIAMSPKRGMPQVISSLFLLKTQGRWKESQVIEHAGPDGEALQQQFVTISLPQNGREVSGLLEQRVPGSPRLIEHEALPIERQQ